MEAMAPTLPPTASTNDHGTARAAGAARVLVVDDSAIVRGVITNLIEREPDIRVVGSASNGAMAVNVLTRCNADVIVLDIEMPVMDGLSALPKLLAVKPRVKIIMASTLTQRGAEISLKALAAGAADYVAKPASATGRGSDDFRRELVAKIRALAFAKREPTSPRPAIVPRALVPAAAPAIAVRPQAIAIASSTGGPQALFRLMPHLAGVKLPIFITQHMPPTFTAILAEHVARQSGRPTEEAKDGATVEGGKTYIAPGDHHLVIEAADGKQRMRLTRTPPENFCRPSADPMLRSLAAAYAGRLICVVLTGMGQDGLAGCQALVAAGGAVVAQDEATSVVWGMPGAVANAGICSAVLPLDEIGPFIRRTAAA